MTNYRKKTFLNALAPLLFAAQVTAAATFEDVTAEVGLQGMHGYHSAWADFDNDGWVDLHEYKHVWRNVGGRFEFVAQIGGVGVWGDYDNDGLPDIFCARDQKLYRNVDGHSFVDETKHLPSFDIGRPWSAAWADFDNDGHLDFYVTGFEGPNMSPYHHDTLIRNKGNATFEQAWTTPVTQPARGVSTCDFDEDGDADIYVSNYRLEPNLLWRNEGKAHEGQGALQFSNVATAYGATGGRAHTIGSAWGDLDNDGHIDLFVANFAHPGQPQSKFLRNLGPKGDWTFEDMSKTAGLAWVESYASPSLADIDNDGDLDLFITSIYSPDTCVLYRNNTVGPGEPWTFTDITHAVGLSGLVESYQGNWADFDNDGDLDLVADKKLFRNSGNANNWLKLRLEGTTVNRSAIGAQARVFLNNRILTRQVEGATGEMNQNDLTLHFGLGKHKGPVTVKVAWPGGRKQTVTAAVNTTTTIRQTR